MCNDEIWETLRSTVTCRDVAERYLQKGRGGMYCCPACGSGTGPNRTAALSICHSDMGWKCHSMNCGRSGDVFGLMGYVLGTTVDGCRDRKAELEAVAEMAGVSLDDGGGRPHRRTVRKMPVRRVEPPKDYTEARKAEREAVLSAISKIYEKGFEKTLGASYLLSRGISLEKAKEWKLGWDPKRKRIVIPYRGSTYYHIDRDCSGKATNKYLKPKTSDVGPEPLFNPGAVKSEICFVVEGALDALAVEDCGFAALALTKAGDSHTAERIAELKPTGVLCLLLDNDDSRVTWCVVNSSGEVLFEFPTREQAARAAAEKGAGLKVVETERPGPGQAGAKRLGDELGSLGILHANIPILKMLGAKDPFEAWQKDSDRLAKALGWYTAMVVSKMESASRAAV